MGNLFLTTGSYISNSKGMDAIVNAQNKYMINGSGICGAVYNAAGSELLTYCKEHYKQNMNVGEVRITPGFKLNMDILHALAAKFYEEDKPIEKLIETYENLLDVIFQKKYKKVLFNSLGTGIFGYKHEQVAEPVIKLLVEFCKSHDTEIYFNNMYPVYKDIYLEEYLKIQDISLKNSLLNKDKKNIESFLKENSLTDILIDDKYYDFVQDKTLEEMCLSEKIINLEYALKNNLDILDDIIKAL